MSFNILVTGAGGFIGRSLVRSLANENHHIIAVDNNYRGNLSLLPKKNNISTYQIDIVKDINKLKKISKNIDIIFHLAAINGTDKFYKIPEKVLEVGIIGTHNILKLMMETKARKIIFSSSSEVYNNPKIIPTPENIEHRIPDILNPRFSYSGSKTAGELMIINYLRGTNKHFTIFRPHNVIGENMGFNHVIPQLVEKIFLNYNKKNPKDVVNIDIQGSGKETRSFVYIEDAIESIKLCSFKGENNQIFHIGNEDEHSILELARELGNVFGVDLNINTSEIIDGSPIKRCPKITAIKSLGYKPKFSFNMAVRKTANWYWNFFQEDSNDK